MLNGNTLSLCCLVGMSGSGKSSIAQAYSHKYHPELTEPIVVSYTTRPRRSGERENCDHKFVSSDVVDSFRSDMVAYTKIGEYEYWATVDDVKKAFFYIIDPDGIASLQKRCGELGFQTQFAIVYCSVPEEIRYGRLKKRGDSEEQIQARLKAEQQEFQNFISGNMNLPYQTLDNSETLSDAVIQLHRLLKGTPLSEFFGKDTYE